MTRMHKLERLRAVDAALDELRNRVDVSETLWNDSHQTMDDRRSSCINVAAAVAIFLSRLGVPRYATERLNDLLVALGEFEAGRTSVMLQRADRPTRTLAATDLSHRAMAQVCVDFYRRSGLTAHDARTRTARLFVRHGFKNFSYSKIKTLGSSLRGPGASQDPSYKEYQMAWNLALQVIAKNGFAWPPTEDIAEAVAKRLVSAARRRDHRLAA